MYVYTHTYIYVMEVDARLSGKRKNTGWKRRGRYGQNNDIIEQKCL